jgi:NAD(P)-dependent dehydrogenase (short-subunit alcohol dehydrogenase family)
VNRLTDRVAVVTGAGGGIGRATAMLFAAEGAKVACVDISRAMAVETVSIIEAEGGIALPIEADVSSWDAVEKARSNIIRQFGGVQILINNAGVGVSGEAAATAISDWHRGIDVNLGGAFFLSKAFWSELKDAGGAAIVNTSSIMALGGDRSSVVYCAAKAALIGLTKALAADGARHGVRVNCVCPGFVDTPLFRAYFGPKAPDNQARIALAQKIPIGRVADAADIAKAFLYLASSDASYVTGTTLVVDGGATLGYHGSDV